MPGEDKEIVKEVLVLGAGISGLATAKCMRDAGFDVTVLERTGNVGGLWAYKEKNYGVMRFTHINVSKHNYCFSDYPIPDNLADYLHNSELASYIENYTDHFDLRKFIEFNTQVNKVERIGDTWKVTVEKVTEDKDGIVTLTGEIRKYVCKFLAIATGHHSKPSYPSFPGLDSFTGKSYHSVDYKDVDVNEIQGKKVVIVGIGNSAIDVACNAASVGRVKPVYLSTRSGAWVVPNYIFGVATDHYACRLFLRLPWQVGTFIFEKVIAMLTGHPNRWNLNPKMHALQTQPTVSPTCIHHIQRGEIKVVPNVKRIEGKQVIFEDGSSTEADHLILCTGYTIDLPFLPEDVKNQVLDDKTNAITLYKNVFSPDIGPSLALIGFVQPASGGVLTMSETQARWWAELCRGNVRLPSVTAMRENMAAEMEYVKTRWFHSSRHTIQRDPILYNDEIASFFGAKPELKSHPWLAWRLLLGSCGAAQWRLQGPGRWEGAGKEVKKVPVAGLLLYSSVIVLLLGLLLLFYLLSFIMH